MSNISSPSRSRLTRALMVLPFSLLIGYLCGAWLTPELVSFQPSQTVWNDIRVYAWMIFWPAGLVGYFAVFLWSSWWYIAAFAVAVVLLFNTGYDRYNGFSLFGWHFS